MKNWNLVEIGNSGLKIADGNYSAKYPNSSEFISEGVPFIRANNFKNKTIIDDELYFISSKKHSELKKGHLLPDDVLVTTRGNIGQVALTPERHKSSNINAQIVLLRCNEFWIPKYLLYVLTIDFVTEQFSKLTTGTALKQLPVKNLKKIKIPLPPLPQQKKIANILDAADELRQNDKALIAKYDELIQALFLDMFGDPVSNPKDWEKVELGKISKISSGSTPSRENESYYDGKIPWVKTGEVNGKIIYDTSEKISKEALTNSSCKLYPKGSLIIAMYGQGKTRGQIGMLGIDATTNQACGVMPPSDKMNFNFLFKLLQLNYEDLRSLGRGGNQPNLNSALLKSYEVINPPIDLQKLFAERVAIIEEQKAIAQKSLEKSEELFNSLLQKAFKGELL